jgi:hypothetical protein
MEWVLFYLGLAIVVGVAANTRGRSGLGWFMLALLISPLISGLLVLALPRVETLVISSNESGGGTTKYETASSKPDGPFEPEGILRGFPYRVRENASIEAMMTGGLVRFRDMDQFLAAVEGRDEIQTKIPAPVFDRDSNSFDNLPVGSKLLRHLNIQVAFLPDGSVKGETDHGIKWFHSFEDWRKYTGT